MDYTGCRLFRIAAPGKSVDFLFPVYYYAQKHGSAMILEVKEILQVLDRFIGHYPIYFYLVDSRNTIAWFNQYMGQNLPEMRLGQPLECFKGFSPCPEPCAECLPAEKKFTHAKVEKNLLKARVGPTGTERYIEFFNLPILQPDGQVEGVLRLGIDVTEDEKLQEALRETEKLFKAIVDTSADAVIFLDNEDRILSWNKGAEEIFGYSAGEIIGKSIQMLVPKEVLDFGELDYLHEVLSAKGMVKKFETRRLHKNGRTVYVDISCSRVYDENGNLIGTSEILKDIEDRKHLEFELLRTIHELSKLNQLNEIIHRVYDEQDILRIILIAITAGEGLRFNRSFIIWVDKKEQMLTGHLAIGPANPEEAKRIWGELHLNRGFLKDIVQAYKIDLEGADRGVNEIVQRIRVPLRRRDHILIHALHQKQAVQVKDRQILGSKFPALTFDIDDTNLFDILASDTMVIAPVYSKKEPLGVIIADNSISRREISIEDVESLKLFANQASSAIENARLYHALEERISDLQNAYRQLAENQEKLVRAEKLAAIGEMSAKIAHEIRNPLVSIGGFARLIEKKIAEPEKTRKYAEIIKDQVDNLENILNNILSAANPPKPQKRAVAINHIIEQVVEMLGTALQQRNIEFSAELQETSLPIFGDERLLHQAFLNVFKNAIEALDGRLEGAMIRVTTRPCPEYVEVQISDNGPGIETGLISKIFQAFFTTKSRGTGLGLAVVQQIVESHSGRIEVKSQPNEGTTFYIRLPFATEAAAETVEK